MFAAKLSAITNWHFSNGPFPASFHFYFLSFQANNKKFDNKLMWKMSIQYPLLGLKLTISWTSVFFQNHVTRVQTTQLIDICLILAIPGLFFIFVFSLQLTIGKQIFNSKICRWLDSNCRLLVLEATALPTVPHHCP